MAAPTAMLAEEYLSTAGVWDRVRYRVVDALQGFAEEAGDFEVVYCDVDKDGYPDYWRAARDRIRSAAYGCVITRSGAATSQPQPTKRASPALRRSSGSTTGWWPRTAGMSAARCQFGTAR